MKIGKDDATSWIVLFSVTFSLFLENGLIKSCSVLLPDMKEQFLTNTWVVGSSISIVVGLGSVIGLTADLVVTKFGARVGYMTCGLVSTIGLIICSYATNILVLFLGMSCIGFLILQDIIAIGIVPDYFDSNFNTAVAIYSCGTGLGIVFMPILTQTLSDIYGWRGTMLLLGGLCMQSIPTGALIRRRKNSENMGDKQRLINPVSSPGSSQNSCYNTVPFNQQYCSRYLYMMMDVLNLSLLTKVQFISHVLVPSFVCGFTATGWVIYIVSYASSEGASLRQASIVSTCGGIGLFAIRIVLPFLQQTMTYKQLMYLASISAAISLALTTQFNDFISMCVMAILFGMSYGILGVELYIANKHVMSESEYLKGVAWIYVVLGVAGISTGVLTGWFFDATGNFTLSFVMLAAVAMVTSVSLGLHDICRLIRE